LFGSGESRNGFGDLIPYTLSRSRLEVEMTRRVLALSVLGAAIALTATPQEASALFGKKKKKDECPAPCATAPCDAGYTVAYVDQVVTAYKTETETKKEKVKVSKPTMVKESYKYWVCEPVTTKQEVTVHETKTKQVEVKYHVYETIQVKEKAKVCQMQQVTKDVQVTVCEPQYTKSVVMKTVCETVCVPVTVTKLVPAPCAPCATPCGGCAPAPCAMQAVTCTVMQRQVVSKQVPVEVTTCTMVSKVITQKVTVCEPVWVEQDVIVNKCQLVEKKGMQTVCYTEPVKKMMDVTTMQMVEKTGEHMVCKMIESEEVVDVVHCKVVPYQTVVKVAVKVPVATCGAPCAPCAPAAAPAAPCCN
jgi:hypothetical protein